MEGVHFGEVALFLAEPNQQVSQWIRITLIDLGFREINDFEKISHLSERIETVTPDLIIADVDMENHGGMTDGGACGVFFALRHSQIGNNPFVPIIATTWKGNVDLIRKVIDSGADDLLIKPLSMGQLIERINRLVHFRKLFVVTSDYIGPDRHKAAHPQANELPLLKVPNTLQAKATGKGTVNCAELQKTIDYAVSVVNEHKMIRYAHKIVYLTDLIVPAYRKKTPERSVVSLIERLIYVTGDLAHRMKGTRFGHVSKICMSLLKVAEAVHESAGDPDPRDLKLLPELALATRAAFTSDEKIISMVHDISVSVERKTAG